MGVLSGPGEVPQYESHAVPLWPEGGEDEDEEEVPWRTVVAYEGRLTKDRRLVQRGALAFPAEPIPLLQPAPAMPYIIGRVDRMWREGDEVWAEGVATQPLTGGPAIEVQMSQSSLRDDDGALVVHRALVRAVASVPNPSWGTSWTR